jgi:hypothetical protein
LDELPIVSGESGRRQMLEMLGRFDGPAYLRRARGVQQAYEGLLARCRRQRAEWLAMVRLLVGELAARAGGWAPLEALLGKEQADLLAGLHAELSPKLRVPVKPTTSARALRRAIGELNEALERFNRRWRGYLDELDLNHVNNLRDGYNRYYLLEKECALGSPVLARMGFRPLPPLPIGEVEALVPLLPVFEVRA